jgi:hypothetical protein
MNEETTDDMLATHILMLAISLLLGSLPAAAVAHPVSWHAAGHMTFTGGNPPTGGNLTASGTATHLGQGTAIGVLRFSPGPELHLILASGQQTFTVASGDELHGEFEDAVLGTTTGIATGVFLCLGGIGRFEEASGSDVSQAGDQCEMEGYPVPEEDLAHLSPARFEHVNPCGKYVFPIDQASQRHGLRPLRAA